jgi:hypothetical protein
MRRTYCIDSVINYWGGLELEEILEKAEKLKRHTLTSAGSIYY